MKERGLGTTRLPFIVWPSIIRFAERTPLWRLILLGIGMYLVVVVAAVRADLMLIAHGHQVAECRDASVTDLWDLMYFNFVTILTVGYGDYTPVGWGRLIAVTEAFLGVGMFGTFVGVFVVKLMLPRRNAIVFSKCCYFVENTKRFVVVFANTMDMPLVNAEMCSVLKIGRGGWVVRPSYTAPYVGDSAWSFATCSLGEYDQNYAKELEDSEPFIEVDLTGQHIYTDDGVKFGISGSYGFTTFSAAKKYEFTDVYVISRREDLDLEALRERRLYQRRFRKAFQKAPQNATRFLDYAVKRGATIVGTDSG